MDYQMGYCDGWLQAVMAMQDLCLAEKLDVVEASHRCLEHYRDGLLQSACVPLPQLERKKLATVPADAEWLREDDEKV